MQGRRTDEQLGGSASKAGWMDGQGGCKVDKASQAGRQAEKLGRTSKKATGGRERHSLCHQGWASTTGR